jgi:hypothetical protein
MNLLDMKVDTTHLFLRKVCNVTGHGSSDDEAASLSLPEVKATSSRAVVHTSQISLNDLVPLLDWCVEDTAVGSTASIGDEDIDFAKILDDILDKLLYLFIAADIALVCLRLDAVLLRQLFGILLTSLRAGGVCDSNVGTKLSTASGGFSANTGRARGTGDNDNLPLEAEELGQGGSSGRMDRHIGGFARNSMGEGYVEVGLRVVLWSKLLNW